MDNLIVAIKKRSLFLAIIVPAFALWLLMCCAYHKSYWYSTIYRAQTVDFNLLHHTLPTTLSQMILAGRDDLIEKVLDANYGLFGLVITDRSGQSILFRSSHGYHQHKAWEQKITVEDLAKIDEPYDILTDPPPLEPRFEHSDPRQSMATQTIGTVSGKQLGRVYYLRDTPPTLLEDLRACTLGHFWELGGPKRGYFLITLITLGLSNVAILSVLLRRRQLQFRQQQLEHLQRELAIGKKALEHLSAELSTQKARKVWLDREADKAYKRALTLGHSLVHLRDAIIPAFIQAKTTSNADANVVIGPPLHSGNPVLAEIESMIPDLANGAGTLKAQAAMLNDYCAILEQRQFDMEKLIQESSRRISSSGNILDMERYI